MKGESAISSWQLAVLLFLSRVMQFFFGSAPERTAGGIDRRAFAAGFGCGERFAFAARVLSAAPASR